MKPVQQNHQLTCRETEMLTLIPDDIDLPMAVADGRTPARRPRLASLSRRTAPKKEQLVGCARGAAGSACMQFFWLRLLARRALERNVGLLRLQQT